MGSVGVTDESLLTHETYQSTGGIEGGETVVASSNNYKAPVVNNRRVPIRDRLKSKVLRRPVVTKYY